MGNRAKKQQAAALGREGEVAAERLLVSAGLVIVERRYRRRCGELDLVALEGCRVVFVEVKTRRGEMSHGPPAASVGHVKRRRLARTALWFLVEKGWEQRPTRFDVVEVWADDSNRLTLRHLSDAFRLEPRHES